MRLAFNLKIINLVTAKRCWFKYRIDYEAAQYGAAEFTSPLPPPSSLTVKNKFALGTATLFTRLLNWRARDRSVRAKHAAITR